MNRDSISTKKRWIQFFESSKKSPFNQKKDDPTKKNNQPRQHININNLLMQCIHHASIPSGFFRRFGVLDLQFRCTLSQIGGFCRIVDLPPWYDYSLKQCLSKKTNPRGFLVGGWTNPIWKIWVKIGPFPQIGVEIKNAWNHHPEGVLVEF